MSRENVEIFRQLMALGEQARESGLPLPHTDLVTTDAEIDMSRGGYSIPRSIGVSRDGPG